MIQLLRDVSLRSKITISFVLIVLCGTAISTFIGSRIITNAMLNQALKQVRHGLEAARMIYAVRQEGVRKAVTGAATSGKLARLSDPGDLNRLPEILSCAAQGKRSPFPWFCGKQEQPSGSQRTGRRRRIAPWQAPRSQI